MENRTVIHSRFFLVFAIVSLAAVFIGFWKTFLQPSFSGTFSAPTIIYIHASFAFAWIFLFVSQNLLIQTKNYKVHMRLGIAGMFVAAGVAITIPFAGVVQVNRELQEGLGDAAISGALGTMLSALLFLSLVMAGFLYRKDGASHKRLMLLATIIVLWPAWFRFRHYFPSVGRPDIWFALVLADIWIIVACIWDYWINKSIHPVFKFVGAFIILEQVFELLAFNSTPWRALSKALYQWLSS